jgi:hypothetical protein
MTDADNSIPDTAAIEADGSINVNEGLVFKLSTQSVMVLSG